MSDGTANPDVVVWRGLVIDNEMPRTVNEYVAEVKSVGCLLGADGGKSGFMRGFQLLVPTISQHSLDPKEVVRRVQEAGPNSERYNQELKEWSAVCVCGDRGSALHYASRSKGDGIIAKVRVPLGRLTVDGRDFLYKAIPDLCKSKFRTNMPYLPLFRTAFSKIIEEYIGAGRILASDIQLLFRLVDYIVMDRRVIGGHLVSKVNLLGRYGTAFKSAFGVRGGIAPSEIVDVSRTNEINIHEDGPAAGEIRLPDFLRSIRHSNG